MIKCQNFILAFVILLFTNACAQPSSLSTTGLNNKNIQDQSATNIVDVQRGMVLICGNRVDRKTRLSEYERILGKPDRTNSLKYNTIYTYDALGILLYQRPGEETVLCISLNYCKPRFKFSPKTPFDGVFMVNGQAVGSDFSKSRVAGIRGVQIEKNNPAFKAMELPVIGASLDGISLTFDYVSSSERLEVVAIGWQLKGEQDGPANGSQPFSSKTNRAPGAAGSSPQFLATTTDPLANLKGDWYITTLLFGGGREGISTCGLNHQPASIVSHSDGMIELSAVCRDGSQHIFKLVRSVDHRVYLFTMNNKEGVNVSDFPLNYLGSEGWMGSAQQIAGDKEISLSASITPIEGKTWYGWRIGVRPTAEAGVSYKTTKTPYLMVDLTRRK